MAPCGREVHQLALCTGLPRMEYEWLHDGQSGTLRGRLLFWRISGWLIACGRFCGNPRSRRCAIGIVLEVFLWNIHSALLLLMWAERKLRVPSCVMKTPMLHPSFFRSARFLPMRSRVGEVVLARILDLIDGVRAEALSHGETIVGVGVATAGRVDVNTGNIAFANEIMPGWSGQPLGDALRERFECPSAVLGDVQSHALGEARWGAARGAQTAVVMAPGTGLGGGIICHGKIVRGKHGFAGEIGSTMNTLDALDGNLESVAAGSGIEARYYAACGVHQTGAEISHRAQLGEDIARQTIENAGPCSWLSACWLDEYL